MAISFVETTAGSFFSRTGEVGNLIGLARTYYRDGGTFDAAVAALIDELSGGDITPSGDIADEYDLATFVWNSYQKNVIGGNTAFFADLRTLCHKLLRRHLWRDTGQWGRDDLSAEVARRDLQELRRQMVAGSQSVELSTIGGSISTSLLATGNGSCVISYLRGDGLTNELCFVENLIFQCDKDGYVPDGISNHEEWIVYGPEGVDGMHPDWGTSNRGSGCRTRMRTVDPTANNARGNVLVNGFETFSSNIPAGWNAATGTAGADFQSSSAQAYLGSNSLQIIEGTGVNTTFDQSFASAVANYSTSYKLKANTPYAGVLRYYSTGTPGAGVLTISLADSGGTATTDDQAVNNSTTLDLTTATNSWQTKTFVFRTPKTVASGTKFRLRVSTALTTAPVFLDGLAFAEMTELYPGGPYAAIFAGSTPFQGNDTNRDNFTLSVTNTNGGASHARATWHRLLDAIFDLRGHKILLPTASAQTIDDTAIA